MAVPDEGLPRLVAVCDLYFEHLRRHTFPGGCFFASAVLEMGTRPGPVKERVGSFQQRFTGLILQYALQAQELGQLPADEDIRLLVFELNGIILAANANFVMTDDPAALDIGPAGRPPASRSWWTAPVPAAVPSTRGADHRPLGVRVQRAGRATRLFALLSGSQW